MRRSVQYKATVLECYPCSQRESNMRGWAVWMKGHIGVYDGKGGYYAMDGSARNMVHYPLSKNKFTHIIKLCDIIYFPKLPEISQLKFQTSLKLVTVYPDIKLSA